LAASTKDHSPLRGHLSAAALCELTGLTDRRHRQIAAEGYYPPPDRGRYRIRETLIGLFRYYREQLHKKEDNLATERKKYTIARREKLELETDLLRRRYIPRAEIGPHLRNLAAHQRATLQQKLETELPPRLAGLDPLEIQQRLAETTDTLCRIFQQSTRQWLDTPPPPDAKPKPTPKPAKKKQPPSSP